MLSEAPSLTTVLWEQTGASLAALAGPSSQTPMESKGEKQMQDEGHDDGVP